MSNERLSTTSLRYPLEEFARRGNAVFTDRIAEHVRSRNPGDFVAIDVETGDYEVAAEQLDAVSRLKNRSKDAGPQIWVRRVGSECAHHIGWWRQESL